MYASGLPSMGVKRALSESEDSEYSEDECHYATLLLSPSALHISERNG